MQKNGLFSVFAQEWDRGKEERKIKAKENLLYPRRWGTYVANTTGIVLSQNFRAWAMKTPYPCIDPRKSIKQMQTKQTTTKTPHLFPRSYSLQWYLYQQRSESNVKIQCNSTNIYWTTKCRGSGVMEILVQLTSNLSLFFYPLDYFRHSISASVQLRKQNYSEFWDKGFTITIRLKKWWEESEEDRDLWNHQAVNLWRC